MKAVNTSVRLNRIQRIVGYPLSQADKIAVVDYFLKGNTDDEIAEHLLLRDYYYIS